MKTDYTVLLTTGGKVECFVDWPKEPSYDLIAGVVKPILACELEHVHVLSDKGDVLDLFVDEIGHLRSPPEGVNTVASRLYHNIARRNGFANGLPSIVGNAVLFHRRIWF